MAAPLEDILSRLLQPDSAVIHEATAQIKQALKDPQTLVSLCAILGNANAPEQMRQLAAVLIRRKIRTPRHWKAFPDQIKQGLRQEIIQLLIQVPERSVRQAIVNIVATMAVHDLPTKQWPKLLEFIQDFTTSTEQGKKELGMYVMYHVASLCPDQLEGELTGLLQLVSSTLNQEHTRDTHFYAVRLLTEMTYSIGENDGKIVTEIIPRILKIAGAMIQEDEDKACQFLEIFDELLETEVAIIAPHVKLLLDFSLQVASNEELGDAVRVKVLSFICTLAKLKKKAIMKHKAVEPTLQILFTILCSGGAEDDDDEEMDAESHTPSQYAGQVIDVMSLHMPPEKVIPPLMEMVEKALGSDNPSHRRGGYMAMAVAAEGCADYIMNRHLEAVLHCVNRGLNDSEQMVRNAALFALGQFSEHLQPDITKYAPELLPLLFDYLAHATKEAETNPRGLMRCYYALETFIENLEKEFLPYLDTLMKHLLEVLRSQASTRSKELAISAIASAAVAAKEEMQPYFQDVIGHLQSYISSSPSEDLQKLQIQTIDTLGVLARNVGAETFMPLARRCVELGLGLLKDCQNPDLKRSIYGLLAAVSSLLKREMKDYMETIVDSMIKSITSAEGYVTHYKEDEVDNLAAIDASCLSDEEEEEDISGAEGGDENESSNDPAISGISVENVYLEEKEDACCTLGEVAFNTGEEFLPYLDESYKEVLPLVNYPASGVRKGAAAALSQFCLALSMVNREHPSPEKQKALEAMLAEVVPRYLEMLREDEDRTVVMSAVEAMHEMLEKMGVEVLAAVGSAENILTAIKEIFTHKVACQDGDEEEEDEQQAEYDAMLIESAGDILPVMAKLLGGEAFLPFFSSFIADLLKRLKDTRSVAERSFAVGTLAETIEACGTVPQHFVEVLYPVIMRMQQDQDDEVRSNSVYAIGILASHCNNILDVQFPEILNALFDRVKKETNGRVKDNICAATCRMICTKPEAVPLEHVVPVLVQCLPLKEDYEENKTVWSTLIHLYNLEDQHVIKQVPHLLKAVAEVINTDQASPDVAAMMAEFVRSVSVRNPDILQRLESTLPVPLRDNLQRCLHPAP